jgi:hypothetical protein
MKKLLFATAAIAVVSLSLASCKKAKDAVDCVDAAKKYNEASLAFDNSATKANCEAFKAAAINYRDASCVPAELKAIIDEEISTTNCQ